MVERKIDAKDRRILQALKKNARATIRQISKGTNIRPSTVHKRLNALIEDKVIKGFTVDVDERMLGLNLTVFMLISGTLDRYLDKEIMKNPNVVELFGITGEFDLLMKLKFSDMDEFNRFIIEFRARYADSIHKTITMVGTISLREGPIPI